MSAQRYKMIVILLALSASGAVILTPATSASHDASLDDQLSAVLSLHRFTGRVGSTLERRLGRRIDKKLADLGRLAFHDSLLGLNNDNSCSGCHAAPRGFGDSQSIATYEMLGRAIAEFEFTLVFADAPIDKFARGHERGHERDQENAMTRAPGT